MKESNRWLVRNQVVVGEQRGCLLYSGSPLVLGNFPAGGGLP